MDTCTNCGAQLRQGAKFCTTCGARQNPKSEGGDTWGDQSTQIIPAVQPSTEPDEQVENAANEPVNGWPSASTTRSSDDPASRFISALESNMKPADEEVPSWDPQPDPAPAENGWRSAFTPPQSTNWNWSSTSEPAEEEATEGDQHPEPASMLVEEETTPQTTDTTWSSWTTPAPDESTDNAGFTEGGSDEVDYLSGDENIEVSGPETPLLVEDVTSESPETPMLLNPHPVVVAETDLSPDDARSKAIALVDELRSVIRQMSGAPADTGNAAMTLTEATLNIDAFDDVREVLAAVAENPRDISALSDLAGKVDRLQEMQANRDELVDTIERALSDLTGN